MNLTTFVGNRVSLKNDSRKASAGTIIAVTGIAVSFIIMLLAISVVTGFKDEIIKKLTGFNAQISLSAQPPADDPENVRPVSLSPQMLSCITDAVPEAVVSGVINQPAVLKTDSAFQGLALRGLDISDRSWDFVKSNMAEGSVPAAADTMSVVLSSHTAAALGIKPGHKVTAHFFDGNGIRSRRLTVSGVYNSHFNDFDSMIGYVPASMLRSLLGLDSTQVSTIEIRGLSAGQIENASEIIGRNLIEQALHSRSDSTGMTLPRVENLFQQCAIYINWLNLLDTNVVVILTLMAAVAAFTLISSLIIIILEKVSLIGLLKALGATDAQIRRIFIYLAQRLVTKGLVTGNVVGLSIIAIQRSTRVLPLDPSAYYLNFVPMNLSWTTVIALDVAVMVISAAILIIPSCLISSISPVKSMKYE